MATMVLTMVNFSQPWIQTMVIMVHFRWSPWLTMVDHGSCFGRAMFIVAVRWLTSEVFAALYARAILVVPADTML